MDEMRYPKNDLKFLTKINVHVHHKKYGRSSIWFWLTWDRCKKRLACQILSICDIQHIFKPSICSLFLSIFIQRGRLNNITKVLQDFKRLFLWYWSSVKLWFKAMVCCVKWMQFAFVTQLLFLLRNVLWKLLVCKLLCIA